MHPQAWRKHWAAEKCRIAVRLSKGEVGGSYAEAVIIVCAILSALAADIWSGKRIDRFRFIEMLVRITPHAAIFGMISTPILVQHLHDESIKLKNTQPKEAEGLISQAILLQQACRITDKSLVVTGSEVDRNESDILSICPNIGRTMLRRFSYASLLYDDVRLSYAHEYRPGERAESNPMTMRNDQAVSYINRLYIDPSTQDNIEDLPVRRRGWTRAIPRCFNKAIFRGNRLEASPQKQSRKPIPDWLYVSRRT